MHGWDRIYHLHQELQRRRVPVTAAVLAEELETTDRTIRRLISDLRTYLNAPIETSQNPPGYYYDKTEQFELPGLWFKAEELQALLTLQQLLKEIQPGLLADSLAPVTEQIEALMQRREVGGDELAKRMRFIAIASRPAGSAFNNVTAAVLNRKQLTFEYLARSNAKSSQRTVSPQRLVHYRENWYLDAWCHKRQALRTFAIEQIHDEKLLKESAKEISEQQLNDELASGYGIFSGTANNTAELIFNPKRARWVATEQWHPKQKSEWLDDGSYKLWVPYSHEHELVMDILKYGSDVTVVAPQSLSDSVQKQLSAALKNYS